MLLMLLPKAPEEHAQLTMDIRAAMPIDRNSRKDKRQDVRYRLATKALWSLMRNARRPSFRKLGSFQSYTPVEITKKGKPEGSKGPNNKVLGFRIVDM